MSLKLIVNGEPYTLKGNGSLVSLLKEIGAAKKPVAVLVNDEVSPKKERTKVRLKNGDRIELLTYAGGG